MIMITIIIIISSSSSFIIMFISIAIIIIIIICGFPEGFYKTNKSFEKAKNTKESQRKPAKTLGQTTLLVLLLSSSLADPARTRPRSGNNNDNNK